MIRTIFTGIAACVVVAGLTGVGSAEEPKRGGILEYGVKGGA